MATAILKLGELTVLALIAFARLIVEKMTGNPDYTTPSPALASIETKADEVEDAAEDLENAKQAVIAATTVLDTKVKELKELLTSEKDYVQQASGGDKVKILGAGIPVKGVKTNTPLPAPVVNLLIEADPIVGWVAASWKYLPTSYHVQSYQMRIKVGEGAWQLVDVVTRKNKMRFQITGTGRVWAQVRAVNDPGTGPWSDPATVVIEPDLEP